MVVKIHFGIVIWRSDQAWLRRTRRGLKMFLFQNDEKIITKKVMEMKT